MGWLRPRSGCFTPGNDPVPIVKVATTSTLSLFGALDGVVKATLRLLYPRNDPVPIAHVISRVQSVASRQSPVAGRRTEYAVPAHMKRLNWLQFINIMRY